MNYQGPISYYNDVGIRQLRLPVVDHTEPSLEYMREAVTFIQKHKEKGCKVYVHCKGKKIIEYEYRYYLLHFH